MTDLAICVEGLGKQYAIEKGQAGYRTLRDSIMGVIHAPLQRAKGILSKAAVESHEAIWALKNVSVKIKQGEVVGIIGRNGAGKGTLLKILSQITDPRKDRVEIHGRVGSLLEVGIGFHTSSIRKTTNHSRRFQLYSKLFADMA
jgi:lipopolysaccharide transport system ATP-binding protein